MSQSTDYIRQRRFQVLFADSLIVPPDGPRNSIFRSLLAPRVERFGTGA